MITVRFADKSFMKTRKLSLAIGLFIAVWHPESHAFSEAEDFSQTRTALAKEIAEEAQTLLEAPEGRELRERANGLFQDQKHGKKARIKRTSSHGTASLGSTPDTAGLPIDQLVRQLTNLVLSDVLPSGDFRNPPALNVAKWAGLVQLPVFQKLRAHALVQAKVRVEQVARQFPGGEASVRFSAQSCGEPADVHGLLSEFANYDMDTQTIEFCNRYIPQIGTWREWQTSLSLNARTPASSDGITSISPVAPDETLTAEGTDTTAQPTSVANLDDRSPASSAKAKQLKEMKSKTDPKAAALSASASKSSHVGMASRSNAQPVRKSRLPSSVEDGFEYRMQYGKLVSTFWVVKRAGRYDLLYSNSAGSKTSINLPTESFAFLHNAAQSIRNEQTDIRKCLSASMQIHVVAEGQAEKTVSACVQGKNKSAAELRDLGNLLSTVVR